MAEWFNNFKDQFRELLAQQSLVSKIVAASVLLVIVVLLMSFAFRESRDVHYELLYAGLDASTAASIREELERQAVEYSVSEERERYTIRVPEGQALNLRLDLANTIETAGGKEGWKLFDDKDFGATYFSLQIKKQRAIMGELARTIMQMEMIRNAVVQLSIPEKSLFVEEQEEPTASVMVSLVEDAIITDDQVKTIQAFVAGSIEGLKAENVTVADTQGNELTKIKEVDTVKQELDHQERVIQIHQRQRKDYERYLERKILTQLSSIFGVGHVTANVSVEFDYTHRRQNQIEYEKKGTPIAEATKMSGNGTMPRMAEGVTGVEAHIPTAGTETGVGGTGNQQYVAETIRNYGVGKTETETEHPDYQIKRVAAAVCVDNFPTAITNENGETDRKSVV